MVAEWIRESQSTWQNDLLMGRVKFREKVQGQWESKRLLILFEAC